MPCFSHFVSGLVRGLSLFAALALLSVSLSAQTSEPDRAIGVKPAFSGSGKRVALVVGNGAYLSSPVKNPPKEARSIAAVLRAWAFEAAKRILGLLQVGAIVLVALYFLTKNRRQNNHEKADRSMSFAPEKSTTESSPADISPPNPDVPALGPVPDGRDGKAPLVPRHGDTEAFDLGKGVALDMIYIEGGSFEMGSNNGKSNEKPVHSVDLDGFWMGKFEVTQEQYKVVMRRNPSYWKGRKIPDEGAENPAERVRRKNPDKAAKNPVEQVSWNHATEFCRKLSSKTGRTFRLPTEAEWEYACRAGSRTRFCFGDSDSELCDYAWFGEDSGGKPVGEKQPNDWGLHDMHGNVWEWCSDWYGSYSSGTQKNPKGPSSGWRRVMRGGSWFTNSKACRSGARNRSFPSHMLSDRGFRVVVDSVIGR